MGIRSENYIAIKPGIELAEDVKKHINGDNGILIVDERGTLFMYESNFTPMWARRSSLDCVADLQEELTIQRFLGEIGEANFYMKRAGEQNDWRGQWNHHPFDHFETVIKIEDNYQANVGKYETPSNEEDDMEFTVNIAIPVTANCPEQAAKNAMQDLRDTVIGGWAVDVSSEHGSCTVHVD